MPIKGQTEVEGRQSGLLMQALGLGFAWKVLKAQWVPKHVSEDTINLRRDNKRGRTSMGKPNFINQPLNNSLLQCHINKKDNLRPKKSN